MARLVEICKMKSPDDFPAANFVLSFRCDEPSYKCFEGDWLKCVEFEPGSRDTKSNEAYEVAS